MHRVGVLLLIEAGGKVLLIKRKNTGYRDGWYCLAGGHIDKGEGVAEAGLREANEELGIRMHKNGLKIVNILYKLENGDSAIIFTVRPQGWSGKVRNAEPHKCAGIGWYALNKLPKKTIPYVRHVFKSIEEDIFYSEWK